MDNNLFYEKVYCSETGSEGTCTFDPTFIAIRETITFYTKALAFYLITFKNTEHFEPETEKRIINILSSVIVNADFNSKEFEDVIIDLHNTAKRYEKIYINVYDRTSNITLPDEEPHITDIIKYGEKGIIKNNIDFSKDIRNLYSIIIYGLRSASVFINELQNYKEDVSDYTNMILDILNKLNNEKNSFDDLMKIIKNFSLKHSELVCELENTLIEHYGPRVQANVSKTLKSGASILVSGHNFYELKKILDATKDKNINIYTHDGLINAHSYLKLKEYPNLAGHFQKYLHSTPSDFTAFNGGILITSSPMDEFDSFVRGKIFTTALFSGLGITKINTDDFSKLIETSLENEITDTNIDSGVSVGDISEHLNDIILLLKEKFENKNIDRIFILKIDKNSLKKQEKLDTLIETIPENTFVFSTFEIKRQNFMKIDAYYDYGVLYEFINKLKSVLNKEELPITLFVSHCNIHTLSHLITLHFTGIRKIYLSRCSYFMINPTIFHSLKKFFGIKSFDRLLGQTQEQIKKELYS